MKRSGIKPKQRDILLIPIPFTDLQSVKRRPVVVLSNNRYNRSKNDVIVAAITSNVQTNEYGIVIDHLDVEQGNLRHQSMVRTDKIYTLNQQIILKRFGRLKLQKYHEVIRSI